MEGNPIPVNEPEENLYQVPLTDLVRDAVSIMTSHSYSEEKFQAAVVAACRVVDEMERIEVPQCDRYYYERFLNLMGLSLSMLPWKKRVESFENKGISNGTLKH